MARRANQRVVIIRGVRYRGGSECSSRKSVRWCTERVPAASSTSVVHGDILMAQAWLETEAVLTNKIVTIDIQPGHMQELT